MLPISKNTTAPVSPSMITPLLPPRDPLAHRPTHNEDASAPGLIHMAARRSLIVTRNSPSTLRHSPAEIDASIASSSNSLGAVWCIVRHLVEGSLHLAVGLGLAGPIADLGLRTFESKPG